jgi:hypothetical protein
MSLAKNLRINWRIVLQGSILLGLLITLILIASVNQGILGGQPLGTNRAALLLIIIILIPLGYVIVKNPRAGLTLLFLCSALLDIPISTGTQSAINLTMLFVAFLGGLWVFKMFAVEKKIQLKSSNANLPLILLIVVLLLSWLFGFVFRDASIPVPGNSLLVQAGQVSMFVLSAMAFFLTANQPFSMQTLKVWISAIVLVGLLAIGIDVLGIKPDPFPAISGSLLMWPFIFIAAQLLFNPRFPRYLQVGGVLVLAAWAYWAFLTPTVNWKGGWAPAFFALLLLMGLRSWKVSAFVVMAITITVVLSGSASIFVSREIATGSLYRPLIWLDVVQLTSRSWLFGIGPVNYMYSFRYIGQDSFLRQYVAEVNPFMMIGWGRHFNVPSHNMFIDIYSQTGVLGLIMFVWFAVACILLGWRLSRRLPAGFLRAYVYAVLTGFIALLAGSFFFADWLIPFVYNITIAGFRHSVYTWLLLGTLISISNHQSVALNESSHGS